MRFLGSNSGSTGKSQKKIARVRYTGWEDRELPEASSSNDDGDNVFTSRDANPRPRRTKSITGPSGRRYKFRGYLGRSSQWLPVYDFEDLDAFHESDEYEVERER